MKHVQGKEYYVSAKSEEAALERKVAKKFACYTKNGNTLFHSESGTDLILWNYAVEIPEPKVEPWTEETFPLDAPVWAKEKKGEARPGIIIYFDWECIMFGTKPIPYHILLRDFERVMPDRSIVPCGVVK